MRPEPCSLSVVDNACPPHWPALSLTGLMRHGADKQQQIITFVKCWHLVGPDVRSLYRVYLDNLHQELTFYRLVLGLLRLFEASM